MSNNTITFDEKLMGADGSHFLVNLTYISRTEEAIDAARLKSILEAARRNNLDNGISGVLLFNRQFFLQTIEGSRPKINQLLTNLINDKRHFDLQIIESRQISERKWGKWSMAYATPTKTNQSIYLRYSTSKDFNPYMMKAESINSLMEMVVRSGEKVGEASVDSTSTSTDKKPSGIFGGVFSKPK